MERDLGKVGEGAGVEVGDGAMVPLGDQGGGALLHAQHVSLGVVQGGVGGGGEQLVGGRGRHVVARHVERLGPAPCPVHAHATA